MVEPRTYEFACHITTQIDEANVPGIWDEIQQTVSKQGGTVLASQAPQPQKLSYPIKHQVRSFFGWVQFNTDSEALLHDLDEWARIHPEVLRHVVLKIEAESDKRAAKQAAHLERKAAKAAREGAAVKKTVVEQKSTDAGKLEKDIEDLLGNL